MKLDMTFQRIPARSPMKLFPTPGIKILLKLVAAAATARESAPPKVATVLVGKARQEALEQPQMLEESVAVIQDGMDVH